MSLIKVVKYMSTIWVRNHLSSNSAFHSNVLNFLYKDRNQMKSRYSKALPGTRTPKVSHQQAQKYVK